MRGKTRLSGGSIKERDGQVNLHIRNDRTDRRLTTPELSRGG